MPDWQEIHDVTVPAGPEISLKQPAVKQIWHPDREFAGLSSSSSADASALDTPYLSARRTSPSAFAVTRRRWTRSAAAAARAAGTRISANASTSPTPSDAFAGSAVDSQSMGCASGDWSAWSIAATELANAILTMTRNPSAGIAAAIHPISDGSASTTWAPSESTTRRPSPPPGTAPADAPVAAPQLQTRRDQHQLQDHHRIAPRQPPGLTVAATSWTCREAARPRGSSGGLCVIWITSSRQTVQNQFRALRPVRTVLNDGQMTNRKQKG